MNILYTLIGCPICEVASEAVLIANAELPIDKHITIIEVLPQDINGRGIGDPRLAFLASLHKNKSVGEWGFPLLKLESGRIIQSFGRTKIESSPSCIVRSAYSVNQYVTFIKTLILGYGG